MNQKADGPIGKRIGAPLSGAHDPSLSTGPGAEQVSGPGQMIFSMECLDGAR